MLVTVKGSRTRKASWLLLGAAVVWSANIVRIGLIFLSGVLWGEGVAIDGFHPYIGLVTFAIATAIAVWLLPRFGLTFKTPRHDPELMRTRMSEAVPTVGVIAVLIAALVIPTAIADHHLVKLDPIATALGLPRLHPFAPDLLNQEGIAGTRTDNYTWARRYFGDDSDWTRYRLAGGTGTLRTSIPVIADVVTTSDSQTFDNFGVEACYAFHGYDVSDRRDVDLGTGVNATMLTWRDPEVGIPWMALFWYWPVLENGHTRFQRIVLLLNADLTGEVVAPRVSSKLRSQLELPPESSLRGPGSATLARNANRRSLLVGMGRGLVAASVARAEATD